MEMTGRYLMKPLTETKIQPKDLLCFLMTFLGIILAELTTNFRLASGQLLDSFHIGEYFSAERSLDLGDFQSGTVMIHGLVDVIPTRLIKSIFGDEKYAFPTWLVFQVLNLITAIILAQLINRLVFRESNLSKSYSFIIGIFAGCVGGYRDLFLLIIVFSVYKFILFRNRQENSIDPGPLTLIGLVTVLGIYWNWNRGLVCLIAIIALFISRKKIKQEIPWLALGGATALIIIWITYPNIVLSGLIRNIFVLTLTSKQWRYPFSETKLVLAEVFLLTCLLFIVLYKSRQQISTRRSEIAFLAPLVSGGLQWTIGRADQSHMSSFLWISTLLLIRFLSDGKNHTKLNYFVTAGFASIIVLQLMSQNWDSILLLGAMLGVIVRMGSGFFRKSPGYLITLRVLLLFLVVSYSLLFISRFASSELAWIGKRDFVANNLSVVPPGIKWAANLVNESESDCLFDFTNSGTLNVLIKLPNCTEFAYLVYADVRFEDSLIQQIKVSNLDLIVWSSTFWSYSIDGKPMNMRFPKLAAFLEKNFPNTICEYDYCVRRKL